ncbi:hypothetical protein ASE71_19345 [Ensifer sp. Root954]|nr:hypothetical protein ASD49_19500 [Ensifer sp. Root1298]KQX88653.1 hypothetical protein ASD41_28535 [Ensifer sp. Root1312]KRC22268.1 hypothetical protein ASE29_29205 [Ensifer sp. Root74]KRD74425.1 hypothetical protein ASE71_19345 [Ensifer sp. Root954]
MAEDVSNRDTTGRRNGMKEAMRSNTTTELFRYWNTIRGKRELPRRDELEPSDIRTLLPNLFILERDRNAGISFRLAGTQVCALFGQELRGRQFGMLWLGSQAAKTQRITGQVMTHRVPLVLSAKGRTADAREVDIETLLLPLASSEGESDRVLGALSPLSRPYWLHATSIECLDATGMKVLDPDRTAVFRDEETERQSDAFAKSPATGAFSREFRQFGHLRILEGGRRD